MSRPMRGTTYEQDPRYKDKEAKMLSSKQWPLEYEIEVKMQNVNMEVVRTWISNQIQELIGVEDDILTGLIISVLEEAQPCPKKIHILIGEFLKENTQKFVIKLWRFLNNAQENSIGVPQQYIRERREELIKKKRELEKMIDWVNSIAKKEKKRSRSPERKRKNN